MTGHGNRRLLPWLAITLLAGCSGEPAVNRASVSGTVTLDGKPLESGVVRFVPIDGTPGGKWSVPVSAGEFSVEEEAGPVVGKHRIEIESRDTAGYALDDEQALGALLALGKHRPARRLRVVQIPARYAGKHSPLVGEVTPDGPNLFELSLFKR